MTYTAIRKLQDEMDEINNDLMIEWGTPGCGRLADRADRLQDEIDEAKAGLSSKLLREYGIR